MARKSDDLVGLGLNERVIFEGVIVDCGAGFGDGRNLPGFRGRFCCRIFLCHAIAECFNGC